MGSFECEPQSHCLGELGAGSLRKVERRRVVPSRIARARMGTSMSACPPTAMFPDEKVIKLAGVHSNPVSFENELNIFIICGPV